MTNVIAKAGELTLETTDNGMLVITDEWITDYITLYDHKPQWSCDGRFFDSRDQVPAPILKALDKAALDHYNHVQ